MGRWFDGDLDSAWLEKAKKKPIELTPKLEAMKSPEARLEELKDSLFEKLFRRK